MKTKDETLGEMSHAPHGEENMSVVKGPTHTGSGVPQESIHLLQYLILLKSGRVELGQNYLNIHELLSS